MRKLICEFCEMEFEVDEDRCKNDDEIQCPNPYCGIITKNPLKR